MGAGIHQKIESYINEWEAKCYSKGIPDEVPIELKDKVPNYKSIVMAILKNDLTSLGFEPKQSKYYSMLKRIEIDARTYPGKQYKIEFPGH